MMRFIAHLLSPEEGSVRFRKEETMRIGCNSRKTLVFLFFFSFRLFVRGLPESLFNFFYIFFYIFSIFF